MSTEIQPFDLNKMRDAISERIKLSFMEMIPQEAWNKLIEGEIRRFSTRFDTYENGANTYLSPLERMVRDEITKLFSERLKEELKKPEYQEVWGSNEYLAGEAIKKIVLENSGEIVNAAFAGMIQRAVAAMRNNMQ